MLEQLKILKESCLTDDDQVSLLDQMAQLCHWMTKAGEIVSIKVSQKRMKTWYDQKAWKWYFKLRMKFWFFCLYKVNHYRYSGPFTIEKKIDDVEYVVYTPGRRKEKRLYHVNMLKLYQERKSDEVMSSHVAVCPVVAEANHDMMGDASKLTNLEAF